MSSSSVEEGLAFLEHYGVIGMKWGVRKDEHKQNYNEFQRELKALSDSGRGNDLKAVNAAAAKYDARRKQINARHRRPNTTTRTKYVTPPAKLTHEELKRRINRMEMEKRYNELNHRSVSQGEKIAMEIIQTAGKTVMTSVVAGTSLYAVKMLLDKRWPGISSKIWPKKK